ncbi:hypothetical protein [Polyangium spumosum]|uniref:DUF1415 family protein n=1 Tax=Polyangium spumosum TaxID=889282 RepID=A0A6N7PXE5_9BACT|nr:hypothetical protein [Polyangium spumosum]MRG94764.1 hypothetical protein [Polyangium spumosum]
MAALEPMIRGKLASHPDAPAFAAEVLRVHRRYATEIVQAHALCPFVRDVDVAFGKFCVMLDHEPDLDATREAVIDAKSNVLHVVFPLALPPSNVFERFASTLLARLQGAFAEAPVMAAFHPELVGDRDAAHRLVGLLRRAPDPFVQFIPAGVHEGGTVFASSVEEFEASAVDRSELNFQKLRGEPIEALLTRAQEIRADRDRAYARFADLRG